LKLGISLSFAAQATRERPASVNALVGVSKLLDAARQARRTRLRRGLLACVACLVEARGADVYDAAAAPPPRGTQIFNPTSM
jgi:hypothetical protein